MPYFPEDIMPLTPKSDMIGATGSHIAIVADNYNIHDEEINAIEQYLSGSGHIGERRLRPIIKRDSLLQRINSLVEKINLYAIGGFSSTSGACVSAVANVESGGNLGSLTAEKMIAPGTTVSSFLSKKVDQFDTVIEVFSTAGFPSSGIITLVRPIGEASIGTDVNTVEYVHYSSIDHKTFKNCQRGALGTKPISIDTSHSLPNGNANLKDDCFRPQSSSNVFCKNRWPTINKTKYLIAPFGIIGTDDGLAIEIMSKPSEYLLEPSSEAMIVIRAVASSIGILDANTGVNVLRSANAESRKQKRLTGKEASDFITGIATAQNTHSSFNLYKDAVLPEDVIVGTDAIPVFLGQVSIQYCPVFWRKKTPAKEGSAVDPSDIGLPGFSIVQDNFKAGIAGSKTNSSKGDIYSGVVGYQVLSIATPRTHDQIDQTGKA